MAKIKNCKKPGVKGKPHYLKDIEPFYIQKFYDRCEHLDNGCIYLDGNVQNNGYMNWWYRHSETNKVRFILAHRFSAIISGKTSSTNYTMTVVLSGNGLASAGDYRTTVAYLSKGGGGFKIAHPDPSKNKTHELWHTFVESPTRGENIYRFKVKTTNCVGVVELPDYYKYLNNNDHVHLSPIDKFITAYAYVNNTQTQIEVVSNEDGEFDLFLFGTRKDNFMYEHWKGAERLIDDEGED